MLMIVFAGAGFPAWGYTNIPVIFGGDGDSSLSAVAFVLFD
jgi:hypothetical protein